MSDLVLTEKFSWMAGVPELESVPKDRNVVRIRGIAGKSDVISKNNRHYAEEELKRSARTWIKAPVTINHADFTDPKNKIGQVVWMELDDDGLLEYEADIWKKPYVDLLRSKSTEIRGVSIQAEFLHNRCAKCGERFYDEPTFRNHMKDEHFITVDAKQEPHGIHGQALSIVLAPEEPGIEGTTVEIMETASRGWTQLLETVTKTGIEKVNHMMKTTQVAIETPTSIAIGTTSKLPIKEQEAPKTASDYGDQESCEAAGFHWYDDACHAEPKSEAAEQEEKTPSDYTDEESCKAAGHHWYDDGCHAEAKAEATEQEEGPTEEYCKEHPEDPKCKKEEPPEATEQEEKPPCPEGSRRDPETGECVADEALQSAEIKVAPYSAMPTFKPQTATIKEIQAPAKTFDSLKEKVEKRGDRWCVIHCHGAEAGQAIKCFDTKGEAEAMHRAIQANEVLSVKEQGERPPKDWWDRCVAHVSKSMPGYTEDQVAGTCGELWQTHPEATFETASGIVESTVTATFNKLLYETMLQHHNLKQTMQTLEEAGLMRDRKIALTIDELGTSIANLSKQIQTLPEMMTRNLIAYSDERAKYDKALVEHFTKNLAKIAEAHKQFCETTIKQIQTEAKLRAQSDGATLEKFGKQLETNKREVSGKIDEQKKQLATSEGLVSKLEAKIDDYDKTSKAGITQLQETVEAQKKDYETVLAGLDKVVVDKVKTLEERLQELTTEKELLKEQLEKKHEEDEKTVKETEDKTQRLETRIDNLEDKLKGKFQGQSPPLKTASEEPGTSDYSKIQDKLRQRK